MKKIFVAAMILAILGFWYFSTQFFAPNGNTPAGITELDNPEIVAQNLNIPWEIVFLPGGDMLLTERPGTIKRIGVNRAVIEVQGVLHRGEGGLLGLALHPDFQTNNFIYIYLTSAANGATVNRVERYRLDGHILSQRMVIIDNIPGAPVHDGGRIAFGPDGYLYITTGDAGQENLAQDTNSLAGKILRLRDDGLPPADNPFGNAVYSYGHRNPQGLGWDEQGRLWASEHGRSGLQSGFDEINLIVSGGNYGWPVIEGDEQRPGMITPKAHSGATTTWAPAGLAIKGKKLFFTGLRGQALYETEIQGDNLGEVVANFREQFGRLRAVTLDEDGHVYISTSNRDGRGQAEQQDDRIIKLPNF